MTVNSTVAKVNIESINYFRSGDKSKTFSLDLRYEDGRPSEHNAVFIGSVEKRDDKMEKNESFNKFSNKTPVAGVIIHPIYDIKDICVKSTTTGQMNSGLGMYAPSINKNPIGFTQKNDTAYVLSRGDTSGQVFQKTNLRQKRRQSAGTVTDENYSVQLSETNKSVFNYGSNLKSGLQESFMTENDMLGIEHSVVLEIPQSKDFADYESGDIYGDLVFTKSSYDSQYSTDMPLSTRIDNAREYCGIGECGGTIYLKYYDRNSYDAVSKYNDVEIDRFNTGKTSTGYPYQKIEAFDFINRFNHQALHKSNLFSIQINGLDLSSS